MSVYLIKGKGWRYDFTKIEAQKKEELRRPVIQINQPEMPQTDMAFLDLVNRRLDYVKAYNSQRHYTDHIYLARKWIDQWGKLNCDEITTEMIQAYLIKRARETSSYTANKILRYLRALFNFGVNPKRGWIANNPTFGIDFMPVEKKVKYVPPKEDVFKVIMMADEDTQDYLWTIALTMGRMSEINRLTWDDINLHERFVMLYTRKKRGGHLTPRKIPIPGLLFDILSRRFMKRDKSKPWIFWHRYWNRAKKEWVEGPYKERKRIMRTLCKNANVKYFRFHALRHFGASLLDQANVSMGSIQRILGHENRSTTEIYLHSIGNAERVAMDVLNEMVCEFSHTKSHTNEKRD